MAAAVRRRRLVLVVFLALVAMAAAFFTIDPWVYFPNAWPAFGQLEQSGDYSEAQLMAVGDTINMAFTMLIGVFIVAATAIYDGLTPRRALGGPEIALLLLFACASSACAGVLFYTRIMALQQLAFGAMDLTKVAQFMAVAGGLLVIAFALATFMLAISLIHHEGKET